VVPVNAQIVLEIKKIFTLTKTSKILSISFVTSVTSDPEIKNVILI
jgi:hypothetical protein